MTIHHLLEESLIGLGDRNHGLEGILHVVWATDSNVFRVNGLRRPLGSQTSGDSPKTTLSVDLPKS